MKVGVDSYCYHRFFGEVYPQQSPAPKRMTQEDFILRARELGVDGVSLESCYINPDLGYLAGIKDMLDSFGLDRVWAWGHRDGLEGGTSERALQELISHFRCAHAVGAKVMRVVGSSRKFRHLPHGPQLDGLGRMLREAARAAEDWDIRMAIENHIDFTSDEILSLIERVDTPFLGVNFDTGNFVRLLDDPIKAMGKLAKYCYATHIKDLKIRKDAPVDEWYFFSSTPVGDGIVNNRQIGGIARGSGISGVPCGRNRLLASRLRG